MTDQVDVFAEELRIAAEDLGSGGRIVAALDTEDTSDQPRQPCPEVCTVENGVEELVSTRKWVFFPSVW